MSIEELQEAQLRGGLPELTQSLESADVPTLERACQLALDDKAPDVADSTLERYRDGLNNFRRILGDTDLQEALTRGEIQRFKGARQGEGVAAATINNDLAAISVLTTYALRQEWVDDRPEIKRNATKRRMRYLSEEEIKKYLDPMHPEMRAFFHLLIATGMRYGEAADLRSRSVKLEDGGARCVVEDSKTPEGVRPVFVPGWASESILRPRTNGGRVFPGLTYHKARYAHDTACEEAKIEDYRIHDNRHTFAVHAARAGMPLDMIQRQLGHKHIEMTMRYARFHPGYNDIGAYMPESLRGGVRKQVDRMKGGV